MSAYMPEVSARDPRPAFFAFADEVEALAKRMYAARCDTTDHVEVLFHSEGDADKFWLACRKRKWSAVVVWQDGIWRVSVNGPQTPVPVAYQGTGGWSLTGHRKEVTP